MSTPIEIERINILNEERIEQLEDALWRIQQWADAYPLKVFPEPDLERARTLLEAGGMTLDAVSASNMRHVLAGVRDIVSIALWQPLVRP